jgi:hypothetical protein
MFVATTCPGPYLQSKFPYIVDEVNKALNKQVVNETKPEVEIEIKKLYRVRTSWGDSNSQLGAFESLENAKKACRDGYSVYDWAGNKVYSNNKELIEGDEIKLKTGATYYNGKSIPSWLFNTKLYYRGRNTNGVIFSTLKSGAITGVVKESSIIRV